MAVVEHRAYVEGEKGAKDTMHKLKNSSIKSKDNGLTDKETGLVFIRGPLD